MADSVLVGTVHLGVGVNVYLYKQKWMLSSQHSERQTTSVTV